MATLELRDIFEKEKVDAYEKLEGRKGGWMTDVDKNGYLSSVTAAKK